jgi:hypothetical protein
VPCAKPSRAHDALCDYENRVGSTSKRAKSAHESEKMLVDRRSRIIVDSLHPIRLDWGRARMENVGKLCADKNMESKWRVLGTMKHHL